MEQLLLRGPEVVSIDGANWCHRSITVTLPPLIPVVLAGSRLRTICTAYDVDSPKPKSDQRMG